MHFLRPRTFLCLSSKLKDNFPKLSLNSSLKQKKVYIFLFLFLRTPIELHSYFYPFSFQWNWPERQGRHNHTEKQLKAFHSWDINDNYIHTYQRWNIYPALCEQPEEGPTGTGPCPQAHPGGQAPRPLSLTASHHVAPACDRVFRGRTVLSPTASIGPLIGNKSCEANSGNFIFKNQYKLWANYPLKKK